MYLYSAFDNISVLYKKSKKTSLKRRGFSLFLKS